VLDKLVDDGHKTDAQERAERWNVRELGADKNRCCFS
jgi:hypothetical protein